jgi:hypothetical protein
MNWRRWLPHGPNHPAFCRCGVARDSNVDHGRNPDKGRLTTQRKRHGSGTVLVAGELPTSNRKSPEQVVCPVNRRHHLLDGNETPCDNQDVSCTDSR